MQHPTQQYTNIESNVEHQNRPQDHVQTIESNLNEHYHQQHPHQSVSDQSNQQMLNHDVGIGQNTAQNLIPNDHSSSNNSMQSVQYAQVEQNMMNATNENGFVMSTAQQTPNMGGIPFNTANKQGLMVSASKHTKIISFLI